MYCPKCGKQLYDDSIFCIRCGNKVPDPENQSGDVPLMLNTPNGKVVLPIKNERGKVPAFLVPLSLSVAVLAIIFAIVAVMRPTDDSVSDTGAAKGNEINSASKDKHTLPIGEQATLGDWEIIADSYEDVHSIENGAISYKPDEGSCYIVTRLTVKNNGTSSDSFLPTAAFASNDVVARIIYKGEYEFSPVVLLGHEDDLHDAYLNPLSSKSGIIAFPVAEEAAKSDELVLVLTLGRSEIVYTLK